jgi:hypothetical protein
MKKKNMYMRRVCYKWAKVHTVRLYFFEKKKNLNEKNYFFRQCFQHFFIFFLAKLERVWFRREIFQVRTEMH